MVSRRIRSIGVFVASVTTLEVFVPNVGRVQRVTKEACHVDSDVLNGSNVEIMFPRGMKCQRSYKLGG